jgi:hypothetical protein
MKGLSEFKTKTLESFPQVSNFWDIIERFILDSDCERIEVKDINFGIAVSLTSGTIFSNKVFQQSLPNFLFTTFHEFAHQYQFKKYGNVKMMELYTKDISLEESSLKMKEIEVIADEFAKRKLRELQKKGHLMNTDIPNGIYSQMDSKVFIETIKFLKSLVPPSKKNDIDKINEVFYQWLTT